MFKVFCAKQGHSAGLRSTVDERTVSSFVLGTYRHHGGRQKVKKMCLTVVLNELSKLEPAHASNVGVQSTMLSSTGCVALLS